MGVGRPADALRRGDTYIRLVEAGEQRRGHGRVAVGVRRGLHSFALDARTVSDRVRRLHLPHLRRLRLHRTPGIRPVRHGAGGVALLLARLPGPGGSAAGRSNAGALAGAAVFQPVWPQRHLDGVLGIGPADIDVAVRGGRQGPVPVPGSSGACMHVRNQGDRLHRHIHLGSGGVRDGGPATEVMGIRPHQNFPVGRAGGIFAVAGYPDPPPMDCVGEPGTGHVGTDAGKSSRRDDRDSGRARSGERPSSDCRCTTALGGSTCCWLGSRWGVWPG